VGDAFDAKDAGDPCRPDDSGISTRKALDEVFNVAYEGLSGKKPPKRLRAIAKIKEEKS